jgi:hypothetical protein
MNHKPVAATKALWLAKAGQPSSSAFLEGQSNKERSPARRD